jgi:hypothetical protein
LTSSTLTAQQMHANTLVLSRGVKAMVRLT